MPSYVITGAARGIGLEFVRQLSSNTENTVFALVRTKSNSDKITALGRANVHLCEADIRDADALKLAAEGVSKVTGGKLDVLVNNAALLDDTSRGSPLDGYPNEKSLEDTLQRMFDVNVVGVIRTINAFLPLLRNGETKKVITLGSGVGDYTFTLKTEDFQGAPYSISKAAIVMAIAKYAVRFKKDGFIFLTISPGLVNTEAAGKQNPSEEEKAFLKQMISDFRRIAPDFSGPITPEESVSAMLKIFDRLTIADTGSFISHKGNQEWL